MRKIASSDWIDEDDGAWELYTRKDIPGNSLG
jgi:hypothetical protein